MTTINHFDQSYFLFGPCAACKKECTGHRKTQCDHCRRIGCDQCVEYFFNGVFSQKPTWEYVCHFCERAEKEKKTPPLLK
jgi:hypothetical protein